MFAWCIRNDVRKTAIDGIVQWTRTLVVQSQTVITETWFLKPSDISCGVTTLWLVACDGVVWLLGMLVECKCSWPIMTTMISGFRRSQLVKITNTWRGPPAKVSNHNSSHQQLWLSLMAIVLTDGSWYVQLLTTHYSVDQPIFQRL